MNKLVRDRIPEIMKKQGKNPVIKKVTDAEYLTYLYKKLREEVDELIADETAEEVADVLEVLHAICVHKGYSPQHVDQLKVEKAKSRGGFEMGFVVLECK